MNKLLSAGSIVQDYPGTPEDGLLAWIDPDALKIWWQAADARIDPVKGGMYYIRWHHPDSNEEFALMGIISEIDPIKCSLHLQRILYARPDFRLLNLDWQLRFEQTGKGSSRMVLRLDHSLQGKALEEYRQVFHEGWPAVFAGLASYLRQKCNTPVA